MAKFTIITSDDQYQVEVSVGSRILNVACQAGIALDTLCDGNCGNCKVQIIEEETQKTLWVLAWRKSCL
ncbi:ferredoxin [Sporomusaceae bacterium BoRhaA]|uniref:2Fe-2S iron-sulfur cluster-binding protein n=1 Tax=Pelorhabdus rhamnosifermentans TaxID=2772457 RepID=UPI001C062052|nr:2Fe-2S iron-sulfur cluster-binding protein [Pelorhabdus rhamnosifermentans]MBU2703270.1 ferredoxin [Pelorhabdus rhamnosifermentans]